MKNLLTPAVLMIALLGCDISKYVNSGKNDNTNAAKPTAAASPVASSSPVPSPTPAKPGIVSVLKKSTGKYPEDIKLLENAEMKYRLKKLLGKDFPDMKANWNVETPMRIEGDVFMASGCEQHNCGSNMYLMFIDLRRDNINIFHVNDEGTKHYFEHGEIALPKDFADEVAIGR